MSQGLKVPSLGQGVLLPLAHFHRWPTTHSPRTAAVWRDAAHPRPVLLTADAGLLAPPTSPRGRALCGLQWTSSWRAQTCTACSCSRAWRVGAWQREGEVCVRLWPSAPMRRTWFLYSRGCLSVQYKGHFHFRWLRSQHNKAPTTSCCSSRSAQATRLEKATLRASPLLCACCSRTRAWVSCRPQLAQLPCLVWGAGCVPAA